MTTFAPDIDTLYELEDYFEDFLKKAFQQKGFPDVYAINLDYDVKMPMPRLCITSIATDSEQEDSIIIDDAEYYATASIDVDVISITPIDNKPLFRKYKGAIRALMQRIPYIGRERPEWLPYHNIVRCVSSKPTHDSDPELGRDVMYFPYTITMQIRPEAWPQ